MTPAEFRSLATPNCRPRRVELQDVHAEGFDADDYNGRPKPAPATRALHAIPADVYGQARALQVLCEKEPLAAWRVDGLRLPSVANLREHWATKAKRTNRQRTTSRLAVPADMVAWWRAWGSATSLAVLLVRVSPRPLDSDNLARSCKSSRDGIADALGVDDRDERVRWVTTQEAGPHALRVVVVEGRRT